MTPPTDMSVAIELCRRFEGLPDGDPTTMTLDPYLDPVGIWTVGYGHAIRGPDGRYLRGHRARGLARALYPRGLTRLEAEALLLDDLRPVALHVASLVRVPLQDREFNALVSFDFNCGGLTVSRLLRCVNGGQIDEVLVAFMGWCAGTVDGVRRRLPGLVRRRACEAACYAGATDVAITLVEAEPRSIRDAVAPLLDGDLGWLRALISRREAECRR